MDWLLERQDAIEKLFSPEFRNRLDAVIHFQALNFNIVLLIVDKFIAELNQQLTIKKVALTISPAVRSSSTYSSRIGSSTA